MKDSLKYISLVSVFIILIFSVTATNLLLKYDENGSFKYSKEYYEIRFNNVKINYDLDASIKLNDENNFVHFDLNDLNEFIDEKEFHIDLTNLGNKDVFVTNAYISNIDTNVDLEKVDINTSISNGDRISGGSSKRLFVKIKYNGKKSKNKKYFNFNINYAFSKS
jgi:hypothetical protein